MRKRGVRLGHAVHTSTQRYVDDDPHVGRAGNDQRNGVPQKKQNRLSAFTIVPQFGQRFFRAVAAGSWYRTNKKSGRFEAPTVYSRDSYDVPFTVATTLK